MDTEEKLGMNERRNYLRLMRKRYRKAGRSGRSELLDEMEAVTGMHRKSLIRLLNGDLERRPRRKQRGRKYGVKVHLALKVIGESTDYVCAERLQPNLVWLAEHLTSHGELEASPELLDQLSRISVSTVRRVLQRLGQDQPRLPRKGPREANSVARRVPIKCIPWDEKQPGHFEVDLVHHCGPVPTGHYVHSLQLIDVATGWSERVATLGRSYRVMRDGFCRVRQRLPFPTLEIHSDNGSEFLNDHMERFWKQEIGGVELSRGRRYRKNDQRFVEQKNNTLVRAYLGHQRLDTVAQTNLLNLLYDKMWLYYNFFQPVMHLIEKTVVTTQNGSSRTRRRHDQARTPFDRLCATDAISEERRRQLAALRDPTNPRQLRREIYAMINHILSLPGAVSGNTESVFETLMTNGGTGMKQKKGGGLGDTSPLRFELPADPPPPLRPDDSPSQPSRRVGTTTRANPLKLT